MPSAPGRLVSRVDSPRTTAGDGRASSAAGDSAGAMSTPTVAGSNSGRQHGHRSAPKSKQVTKSPLDGPSKQTSLAQGSAPPPSQTPRSAGAAAAAAADVPASAVLPSGHPPAAGGQRSRHKEHLRRARQSARDHKTKQRLVIPESVACAAADPHGDLLAAEPSSQTSARGKGSARRDEPHTSPRAPDTPTNPPEGASSLPRHTGPRLSRARPAITIAVPSSQPAAPVRTESCAASPPTPLSSSMISSAAAAAKESEREANERAAEGKRLSYIDATLNGAPAPVTLGPGGVLHTSVMPSDAQSADGAELRHGGGDGGGARDGGAARVSNKRLPMGRALYCGGRAKNLFIALPRSSATATAATTSDATAPASEAANTGSREDSRRDGDDAHRPLEQQQQQQHSIAAGGALPPTLQTHTSDGDGDSEGSRCSAGQPCDGAAGAARPQFFHDSVLHRDPQPLRLAAAEASPDLDADSQTAAAPRPSAIRNGLTISGGITVGGAGCGGGLAGNGVFGYGAGGSESEDDECMHDGARIRPWTLPSGSAATPSTAAGPQPSSSSTSSSASASNRPDATRCSMTFCATCGGVIPTLKLSHSFRNICLPEEDVDRAAAANPSSSSHTDEERTPSQTRPGPSSLPSGGAAAAAATARGKPPLGAAHVGGTAIPPAAQGESVSARTLSQHELASATASASSLSLSLSAAVAAFEEEEKTCVCAVPVIDRQLQSFGAVEVLPGLFLGSYADACNEYALHRHRISLVVNVSGECPVTEAMAANTHRIRYLHLPLKDHSDEPISPYFAPVAHWVHEQLHRRQVCRERRRLCRLLGAPFTLRAGETAAAAAATADTVDDNDDDGNGSRDGVDDSGERADGRSPGAARTAAVVTADAADSAWTAPLAVSAAPARETDSPKLANGSAASPAPSSDPVSSSTAVSHASSTGDGALSGRSRGASGSVSPSPLLGHTGIFPSAQSPALQRPDPLTAPPLQPPPLHVAEAEAATPAAAIRVPANGRPLPPTSPHGSDSSRVLDSADCGGVIVHCRMGVSRSASFVLAYLILYGTRLGVLDEREAARMTHADALALERVDVEKTGGTSTYGHRASVGAAGRDNGEWQDGGDNDNDNDDRTADATGSRSRSLGAAASDAGSSVRSPTTLQRAALRKSVTDTPGRASRLRAAACLSPLSARLMSPNGGNMFLDESDPALDTPRERAAHACAACFELRLRDQQQYRRAAAINTPYQTPSRVFFEPAALRRAANASTSACSVGADGADIGSPISTGHARAPATRQFSPAGGFASLSLSEKSSVTSPLTGRAAYTQQQPAPPSAAAVSVGAAGAEEWAATTPTVPPSSAMAFALARSPALTFREAFDYLKRKKPDVNPNIGFVLALRELAGGGDFSFSSSAEVT